MEIERGCTNLDSVVTRIKLSTEYDKIVLSVNRANSVIFIDFT